MEYIEGPSLDTALQRKRLTLQQAYLLFRGIVDGVRHAHRLGLVHRDLKPANVLLATTSRGILPKVTDFGIAKVVEGETTGHTRAGVAMGTPQYMAPEQIRDAATVDKRADVFSLGCILYELVTGRRAFPYDDIVKVYNAVCDGEFTPPRRLRHDLSTAFEAAILGAMEVDRDRRIPDLDTLIAVFEGKRTWNGSVPDAMIDVEDTDQQPLPDHASHTWLPADLLRTGTPDATDPGLASPKQAERTGTSHHGGRQATLAPLATSIPSQGADEDEATDVDRFELHPARPMWQRGLVAAAALAVTAGVAWLAVGRTPVDPGAATAVVEAASAAPSPPAQPDGLAPAPAAATPATPAAAIAAPPPAAPPAASPATASPPSAALGVPQPPPSAPAAGVPAPPAPIPPTNAGSPAAASVPTPAPSAPTVEAAPTPVAVAPPTVRITSLPMTATVWIDGAEVGRTPFKGALPPGKHQVRIRSGETDGAFSIEVDADAENRWCYVFSEQRSLRGACPP
jgi:serine/threonine-protein kinase